MKRYRVINYDFDTRANWLKLKVKDSWEEKVKAQNYKIIEGIKKGLKTEFGVLEAPQKLDNFVELGSLPISIIAFHNKFHKQIRSAYVIGAYYPALVAACSLGERILNQLIMLLRDDYKDSNEYKKVYRKKSFNDWDLMIDTLENWAILLPFVVTNFRELKEIRHYSIHFNPEVEGKDKELALEAIKKLTNIVEGQFSAVSDLPWYIPGINTYVKKEFEEKPFVKRIIIPNCKLVGPYNELDGGFNNWKVNDNYNYEDREISDEEFARLLKDKNNMAWKVLGGLDIFYNNLQG